MAGRFYDGWQVGDRLVHQPSRTVTETDNLLFSAMTHNVQPLHLDAEAAKASPFGQILVNSTFTFSLAVGLSIADTTLGTLVANLGFDKVVTPHPTFLGDTLTCSSEVIATRESRSRPGQGIVVFRHEMTNQRGECALSMERTVLLWKSESDRPGS